VGYYRDPQRNIVLAGFTCAGKSSVGRLLARYLRRPFVDLPAEGARRAKLSLQAITGLGQPVDTAAITRKLTMEFAYRRGMVGALAADTLDDRELARELKVNAYIVFLDAHFEELWRRIQQDPDHRLFAQGVNRGELLLKLQRLRPGYERCELQLFNADMEPERAVKLITHCFLS
jgi:shikimate kinase